MRMMDDDIFDNINYFNGSFCSRVLKSKRVIALRTEFMYKFSVCLVLIGYIYASYGTLII